jgi:hypothetical protein
LSESSSFRDIDESPGRPYDEHSPWDLNPGYGFDARSARTRTARGHTCDPKVQQEDDGPSCLSGEGKRMRSGKQPERDEKKLKARVKELRSKLAKAEASAKRWKKEAGRLREAAAQSEGQVKKLSKRLEKASRAAESSEPSKPKVPERTSLATQPMSTTDISQSAATCPDASWTVLQLRAEARSRGLTGLSRESKAELLSALV